MGVEVELIQDRWDWNVDVVEDGTIQSVRKSQRRSMKRWVKLKIR